ncbi:MAG: hypothetical protein OXH31_00935 [Gammaproteobacteria bacterium]|nr:hypothetical protein [Gammaproteobacteria bacterium]
MTSTRFAIEKFTAIGALTMFGMTGCMHYAPERLHVKIFHQTKYFEEKALGISGVRYISKDLQDSDGFPDLRKLMILKDNDKEVFVHYSLRMPAGTDALYVDRASMNRKSLRFSFESRQVEDINEMDTNVTSAGSTLSVELDPSNVRNVGYHVEKFIFAIPMKSALELTCDEENPERRVVVSGDGGHKAITIHKYEFQGLLEKAKELHVLEIEGNCFDQLGKDVE